MDLGLTRVDLLQVGLTYPKSTRLLPNVSPTERTQQKGLEDLGFSVFVFTTKYFYCIELLLFDVLEVHQEKIYSNTTVNTILY